MQLAPDAKVLVIVVARIGDTLLATPSLRAIKDACPYGKLVVLAHPKRKTLLENLGFIDTLKGISKTSARFRGWFQPEKFDAAFVYGGDIELVRYALRVSKRVVIFDRPELALNSERITRVPLPAVPLHAVHERLMLPQALGIDTTNYRLAYEATPGETEFAANWIAQNTGQKARPLIGIQMFSFHTKAHRDWPVQNFVELMNKILMANNQSHFLILGDEEAASRAAGIADKFPGHVTVAAGKLSLRQTAALIRQLDLYIGVDTGPTHIAGALGINMIALYDYRYPGNYLMPLQNQNCRIIQHPATGNPQADEGMEAISVDRVWHEASLFLASPIVK